MKQIFVFVCVFYIISQCQCDIPSCKTNCTTNEECWRDALAYHSWTLIDQVSSFSSLSVHVNNFQREHSNDVNDSILFIDTALENHLLNESIMSNLMMDLFFETKQILIDFCTNLTTEAIEGIESLPTLICSLSTRSSERMNFLVLLIISVLITSSLIVLCVILSCQTYHQPKSIKIFPKFLNTSRISNSMLDLYSNRF